MSPKRKHKSDELWSRRRDSYHVVEPGKPINGKGYSDGRLALIAAQVRLEKGIGYGFPASVQGDGGETGSDDERGPGQENPQRLIVIRQSLFGPAVPLWEVYREESAICTVTLNRED